MAYYQTVTFTTVNQFLIDLSAFLSANGWTIDYDGVYSTSYRRLHFHKGEAHFDFYSSTSTKIYMFGCTGYASGSAPNAQPGVSGSRDFTLSTSYPTIHFVSTQGAVYFGYIGSGSTYWGSVFIVKEKIGSWSNGFGLQAVTTGANFFGGSAYSTTVGYAQLYYNGVWSTYGAAAGGFTGGNYGADLGSQKSLNVYNGGLVPQRVVLFINNSSDSTKKHPVGYAPGLYKANAGDIYDFAETVTIGSDTYLFLPSYSTSIGDGTYGDFLFKLGE